MSGNQWWKQTTQLRDIKDPEWLNHQIAKQQLIYVLSTSIKNSILPDVIAQIVLNYIITKEIYKTACNHKLPFQLQTLLLSPTRNRFQKNELSLTKLWKANYKKCVGMEFKLKKDIVICGIELDLFFGGVQCYAVLSGYKKTKNKAKQNSDRSLYENQFIFKLIPCDHRQQIRIKSNEQQKIHRRPQKKKAKQVRKVQRRRQRRFEDSSSEDSSSEEENGKSVFNVGTRNAQMIFTEINKHNYGGLKLSAKNMIYKLGFIISDGFYCNEYIDLRGLNKKQFKIDENIKAINWRLLNKSKLIGGQRTYFGEGLIEEDGTSNGLKWFPKMRFMTF